MKTLALLLFVGCGAATGIEDQAPDAAGVGVGDPMPDAGVDSGLGDAGCLGLGEALDNDLRCCPGLTGVATMWESVAQLDGGVLVTVHHDDGGQTCEVD